MSSRLSTALTTIRHLAIVGVVLVGTPTIAYATTPSDVYHKVETIIAETRLLHHANFTDADQSARNLSVTNRRPRHVLQKARETLVKVNSLAYVNGGSGSSVPSIPAREIAPRDVLQVIDAILKDVRALKPVFGVTESIEPIEQPSDKTPSDVYAALDNLSRMIDGLGIPATVPNDVYQIADTVALEIEQIARHIGASDSAEVRISDKAKTPADVYAKAFDLFDALKRLVDNNPRMAPPNGINPPDRISGAIKPAQVLDALNNLLADVAAIKVSLGMTQPITLAPPPSGKSPTNVHDRLDGTLQLVLTLESGRANAGEANR